MTTTANRLGKDTNSVMNWIAGNCKPIEPEVGMGCTILMWTDRRAGTIHKVEGKTLWFSKDEAKRIDKNGISESQDYEYSNKNQDNDHFWKIATLRKDGRWHIGTSLKNSVLQIGHRNEYYDYSF